MSSAFSRKITMSTSSGCLTGDGTPVNQRTGRRQTYRSRIWRSATLRLRKPPPTRGGRRAAGRAETRGEPLVEAANPAADRRGERTLDADQVVLEDVDGLLRQ